MISDAQSVLLQLEFAKVAERERLMKTACRLELYTYDIIITARNKYLERRRLESFHMPSEPSDIVTTS